MFAPIAAALGAVLSKVGGAAAGAAASGATQAGLGALAKKGLMSAGKFGLNFLGNRLMNAGQQQQGEQMMLPPSALGGQMMAPPSVQHAMRPQVQRGFY